MLLHLLLLQKNGTEKTIYHEAAVIGVGISLAPVTLDMLQLAAEILCATNKRKGQNKQHTRYCIAISDEPCAAEERCN
jgi:hypothetical protein